MIGPVGVGVLFPWVGQLIYCQRIDRFNYRLINSKFIAVGFFFFTEYIITLRYIAFRFDKSFLIRLPNDIWGSLFKMGFSFYLLIFWTIIRSLPENIVTWHFTHLTIGQCCPCLWASVSFALWLLCKAVVVRRPVFCKGIQWYCLGQSEAIKGIEYLQNRP